MGINSKGNPANNLNAHPTNVEASEFASAKQGVMLS